MTGDHKKAFPSEPFYNEWITDYFSQHKCPPIGYKKFNRFLRQFGEGQICVKSRHTARKENTQHIYGLVFNQKTYNAAKAEFNKTPEPLLEKLKELLPVTEEHINKLKEEIKITINCSSGSCT